MPYWRLFYHLVWTTKYRQPDISSSLETKLYPFLIAKALSLECEVDAINGVEDHIHIVLSIPPNLSISDVVQHLKGASSHEFPELLWQRGYGALSLGEKQRSIAVAYVQNQKSHHAEKTTILRLEQSDE